MTKADRYENALTTTSEGACDAYNRGVALLLGGNFGALDAFRDVVVQDPGFALGHAALARAQMVAGSMADAKASIAMAEQLVPSATAREQAHVAAMAFVVAGEAVAARAAVKAHVQTYPRDALIAQLCCSIFGLIGFSGKVGREADLLAYTSALLPAYGEDWWMMSMHAISLCETGQVDASLSLMERALALNPRNANGSHFKAHAQYEAGDTAGGRAYLAAWMEGYDPRAQLYGHLRWHQALWALHDGDAKAMWNAVDDGVAPGVALGMPLNILTDTAAILFRAEMAGFPVAAERWSAISDYAAQYFPNPGQSFADMHAALAHAMAGHGDRIARLTETTTGFAGDLVAPVARAWQAIAQQDWTNALIELEHVMPTTERIGGSRAQRDLLELTYVNVLMKLGHANEARRCLATRRPVLSVSPPLAAMH